MGENRTVRQTTWNPFGTFGLDLDFSHQAIIHRINSDLANDLGNLFNRSLAMTIKYFAGRVPQPSTFEGIDEQLRETAQQVKTHTFVLFFVKQSCKRQLLQTTDCY